MYNLLFWLRTWDEVRKAIVEISYNETIDL